MLEALAGQWPLAVAWLVYCVLHSALASLAAKRFVAARWPRAMARYRLGFNLFAVAALLPLLALMWAHPGPMLWAWEGVAGWIANALALTALAGFVVSTRHYDMDEFLGLRQLREDARRAEDQERFHLSPFHRWVRHPWYFFALVLVWTRDLQASTFVSALAISAYFWLGSMLEERKLVAYHGDTYRRYRARVAGLVPLPWKILTAAQAAELENKK